MFVIAAIIMAVVACAGGYLAGRMTAPPQTDETLAANTISLLVAKHHLLPGTVLSEPDEVLEPRVFLRASAPPSGIQNPQDLRGKTLERTISKNTPVTELDLNPNADTIRALTIRAQMERAGGPIYPGSRVDIFRTFPTEDPRKVETKMIVEGAMVLVIDPGHVRGTMTIAVTRDEATRLIEAQQQGPLSFDIHLPPK
jgi:Flp pilus assembly protein CpaB